jgi:hypothetical protein
VRKEQTKLNVRTYRKKWGINNGKELGTGSLSSHAINDINEEHRVIRNEMKRLGLSNGYDYDNL